jgi:hypothetical protein
VFPKRAGSHQVIPGVIEIENGLNEDENKYFGRNMQWTVESEKKMVFISLAETGKKS